MLARACVVLQTSFPNRGLKKSAKVLLLAQIIGVVELHGKLATSLHLEASIVHP
jgi:hypothetical protein